MACTFVVISSWVLGCFCRNWLAWFWILLLVNVIFNFFLLRLFLFELFDCRDIWLEFLLWERSFICWREGVEIFGSVFSWVDISGRKLDLYSDDGLLLDGKLLVILFVDFFRFVDIEIIFDCGFGGVGVGRFGLDCMVFAGGGGGGVLGFFFGVAYMWLIVVLLLDRRCFMLFCLVGGIVGIA